MPHILYSIGYSDRKALQLLPSLVSRGFVFVDVRLTPYSKFPAFQQSNLIASYGSQYKHIRDLGNVNKGTDKPIEIKDADSGMRVLSSILAEHDAVMFCGCRDVVGCHRYVVANLVTRYLPGIVVIEL